MAVFVLSPSKIEGVPRYKVANELWFILVVLDIFK